MLGNPWLSIRTYVFETDRARKLLAFETVWFGIWLVVAIRLSQRPKSLAHGHLLCPYSRSVTRIQIGCGGDESVEH